MQAKLVNISRKCVHLDHYRCYTSSTQGSARSSSVLDLRPLPPLLLKGKSKPVPVFQCRKLVESDVPVPVVSKPQFGPIRSAFAGYDSVLREKVCLPCVRCAVCTILICHPCVQVERIISGQDIAGTVVLSGVIP